MSNSIRQAGYINFHKIEIMPIEDQEKRIDIKAMVTDLGVNESMERGRLSGYMIIVDPSDILNKLPIRGEEIVVISYTDFFDVTRTEEYFIYSVSEINYLNENRQVLTYKLSFVSPNSMLAHDATIRKTYRPESGNMGRISDYVKELFDEYYKDPTIDMGFESKPIDIQITTGLGKYIIPAMNPENAMYFFARRAVDVGDDSQSFRFFETRDRYGFMTIDYAKGAGHDQFGSGNQQADLGFIRELGLRPKNIPIFYVNLQNDSTPHDQRKLMSTISDIKFNDDVNSLEDIRHGFYRRTTWEVDIVNGMLNPNDYEYENGIHSDTFLDNFITEPLDNYVLADYSIVNDMSGSALRENQQYPLMYNKKSPSLYHFRRGLLTLTIFGRNDIFASSIIDLMVTGSDGNLDQEYTGRYLINEIDNVMDQVEYKQVIRASKVGEL